jgi:uncharacterized protein YoxC
MGPGGIATIIAASSLAVIAVAISYTVIRASRLIDEMTTTLSYINKPLKSLTKAAQSVEDLATKVTGATDSFLEENPLAMKAAGVIVAAAKLKKGKKRKVAK